MPGGNLLIVSIQHCVVHIQQICLFESITCSLIQWTSKESQTWWKWYASTNIFVYGYTRARQTILQSNSVGWWSKPHDRDTWLVGSGADEHTHPWMNRAMELMHFVFVVGWGVLGLLHRATRLKDWVRCIRQTVSKSDLYVQAQAMEALINKNNW